MFLRFQTVSCSVVHLNGCVFSWDVDLCNTACDLCNKKYTFFFVKMDTSSSWSEAIIYCMRWLKNFRYFRQTYTCSNCQKEKTQQQMLIWHIITFVCFFLFFLLKPNPGVFINASKKLMETFDFTKNNLIFIPIWYGKSFRFILCFK